MMSSGPQALSAANVGSFAYKTIKDRIPVILTRISDSIVRNRDNLAERYGENSRESLKYIIAEMSRLRHEVTTNKHLTLLDNCDPIDLDIWQRELMEGSVLEKSASSKSLEREDSESSEEFGEQVGVKVGHRWFASAWLLVECYLYRRIHNAVLKSGIPNFDVFGLDKENSFLGSGVAIRAVTMHLFTALSDLGSSSGTAEFKEKTFIQFLKLSLFGNECDLSISGMESNVESENPLDKMIGKQANILVDDSDQLWNRLCSRSEQDGTIVIVLDNSGFELVTDLCLAECFIALGFCRRVIFYGKRIPWFVSDVTKNDLDWTLRTLVSSNHLGEGRLGAKWLERFSQKTFEYRDHKFWTLPTPYNRMAEVCPDLHRSLSEANMIVFKGDLNYRKLLGDLDWETSVTSFSSALRGFLPSCLVSLRVCKADLAVGLTAEQVEKVAAECPDWMVVGKYGLIQTCFSKK